MYKIALDAGHGLYTAGKQTPDGIKEWTLNDAVRDRVINYLSNYENCEIINTDNDEGKVDEPLKDRLNRYVSADVDVFISIHHNAYTGKWYNVTGVEAYTDVNCTRDDKELADLIVKKLSSYTGLRNRGVKKTNFTVITQNKIAAVLVEGGFMDSKKDYDVITSEKGQDAYARAVAESIVEYLGLRPKKTEPYQVKVLKRMNIRKTPKWGDADIVGKIQKGVYTITKEKKVGQTTFGYLLSKTGWISLAEGWVEVFNGKEKK